MPRSSPSGKSASAQDRHLGTMDYIRDAYRKNLSIDGGVLRGECASMYYGPHDHPPREEQANR